MSNRFDESYWKFVQAKFKDRYNYAKLLPTLEKYIYWVKRYVEGNARVLDIGCGFGLFLKLCDEQSWDTYGVDISSFAVENARKNTKARLYVHDVEKKGEHLFSEETFDLITMFDVLEHLAAPIVVLRECYRILKYDGKVVITTPNLNALERVFLAMLAREKTWHGFNDETHINLYNAFSLRNLVETAGFKAIELKTPFYSLPASLNSIFGKTCLGGNLWLLAEKTQKLSGHL